MENNGKENMLNEAVEMLQKGFSKEEALLKYPADKVELAEMLEIAENLMLLPKNKAPKPDMQRKYLLFPSPFSWRGWIKLHKFASFAAPITVFVLLLAGTTYAAMSSLPGQKLFTLKKSGEQLRLKFAASPEAKANLQISIAQQRLQEVEKILKNPERTPEAEEFALNELVSATENSIKTLDDAAKNNSLGKVSGPLVTSLESITKQQEAIVKEIKPEGKIAEASQQSTDKLSEIKRLIVAAGQEQTLTELDPGPDAVVISGKLESVSKNNITVEKIFFELKETTVIKNNKNETLTAEDLESNQQVNVLGTKDNDKLTAQRIIVFENGLEGEVKGVEDEKPENTTTPESIINTGDNGTTTKQSVQPNIAEPFKTAPDIKAGIIIEDPAPQAAF